MVSNDIGVKMKILLVQPYAGYELPNMVMKLSARLPAFPNLTLQQLAGICDNEYDVVAITCRTATTPRTYEIAAVNLKSVLKN